MTTGETSIQYGKYVNFVINPQGNLEIRWIGTDEDKTEFQNMLSENWSIHSVLADIIEDFTGNGWHYVNDIALHDDNMLTLSEYDHDYDYDNDNPLTPDEYKNYPIYCYVDYVFKNEVEELLNNGMITLIRDVLEPNI